MRQTLNRMKQRGEEDRGFTMIELLVVVVIIGILVAIAVPVYLNYRKGAANKSAASDVRGAITVVEQYFTENSNAYPTAVTAPTATLSFGTGYSVSTSDGNELNYTPYTATAGAAYKICGRNIEAGTVYAYNSAVGGGVKKSADTTMNACITATATV